ncbi:hypothetical protein SKAU_G00028830 [Synaphobranchus kaupii]|uniref:Uncharacterized protein n=1 Tax=Synaphobranchus kaupii TaxID=118154 RepID=A0A9Q1GEK0_SYNKA|nr:hypothetical protein SKAU_G00028830 [Synaphobranchus kaupii]
MSNRPTPPDGKHASVPRGHAATQPRSHRLRSPCRATEVPTNRPAADVPGLRERHWQAGILHTEARQPPAGPPSVWRRDCVSDHLVFDHFYHQDGNATGWGRKDERLLIKPERMFPSDKTPLRYHSKGLNHVYHHSTSSAPRPPPQHHAPKTPANEQSLG